MPISCSLFPNFSSSSFRISGFMSRYLIHLYLIFVEGERERSDFSVLYVDIKFFHAPFIEEAFTCPMCNLGFFKKNQVAMAMWVYILKGDKRAWDVSKSECTICK